MSANPKASLKLTPREAFVLLYAASNTMDWPDAVDALFPDPAERRTARRAYKKLQEYHEQITHPGAGTRQPHNP